MPTLDSSQTQVVPADLDHNEPITAELVNGHCNTLPQGSDVALSIRGRSVIFSLSFEVNH